MVRLPDNELRFYTLPVRTAVLNVSFNGKKNLEMLAGEIYRNFRLRDRPLGNTQWELLLNLTTEKVNQDIDVTKITDIDIFLYYTDFTEE